MRARLVVLTLGAVLAAPAPARAQVSPPTHPSLSHGAIHYGKWLTAGATVAFTAMAAREHSHSRRDWDDLLAICRSADDACIRGGDGRYVRTDAELLYQRSVYFDRRANRRLLGAQASLLVTAALFIIDLRGGSDEPDNIPFAPVRVTVESTRNGALVGMRIAF